MVSLKNTIEDLVVEEAKHQLQRLGNSISQSIELSDVAAYALNLLPPMYASTDRGWLQQRKRAHSEMRPKVISAVQKAMMNVSRDSDREVTPLSGVDISSPAHALAQLQKIFNKPHMNWAEVPQATFVALEGVRYGSLSPHSYVSRTRKQVSDIKDYLKRAKFRQSTWRERKLDFNHASNHVNSVAAIAEEYPSGDLADRDDFDSYMLNADYGITNVLEKLVLTESEEQLKRLSSLVSRQVKGEDVAAYALNRLPPMYATSAQGYKRQQQRAHLELADEIESAVVQAILTLSKTPKRLVGPLPFTRFDLEQDKSLSELRSLLQRDDITWRNVAIMVEEALEAARTMGPDWRNRWKTVGKIYKSLRLKPGDADMSLIESSQGDVLLMKANNWQTFGWLADNPRLVARKTLQRIPSVACIELHYPLLATPLTYTRPEMADDGVIASLNGHASI
ncbi:Late competence development protein ComFB [Thalassoporum mexicanum PCC 7367]|uniref:late competence development ComFB family protein n=1 Tax=Thalassoporum mexicanum TaxID=3457544 RepID=UPI00029FFA87|nr:late competence development ComFB family protein [Pseudanabaena sp. PCC 7367]AFY69360.1 Late competence development protein ComFB [Pseudanabaena sp. PCC 7367]